MLGPTGEPKCPRCGNSFQNGTPSGAPYHRRCATCKHVWELSQHSFVGVEGVVSDAEITLTGRTFYFLAHTLEEAVRHCLYTEKLKNGEAFVGPTGLVVHSGDRLVALVKKERPSAAGKTNMTDMKELRELISHSVEQVGLCIFRAEEALGLASIEEDGPLEFDYSPAYYQLKNGLSDILKILKGGRESAST